MKKIYFLIFITLFGFRLNAQCPLTTAVDFTATDIHGQQHNLFSYLNSGKYVIIDFFYTTCGPCQQTAPKIQGAYENFGCNASNVIFLSIDRGDNNAQVELFDNTYGIHCPSISGVEGGGTAINTTYGITAFPTIIMIAPNKAIIEQDIWPIADAAYLIGVISGHGGIAMACSSGIEDDKVNAKASVLSLYPNPASNLLDMTLELNRKYEIQLMIYNLIGEKVIELPINTLEKGRNNIKVPISHLNNGSYIINVYADNLLISTEKLMIIK